MKDHTAKRLTMDVMRPADGHDCTRNGLSSQVPHVEIVFEMTQDEAYSAAARATLEAWKLRKVKLTEGAGAFVLITRPGTIYGSYLTPVDVVISGKWWMFGGNLAHTSNGVVTDVTKERVLSIHDRVES